MVLESQMGRAGSGRQYMSSRRKRGPFRFLAVVLVVAGVGGLCWYMIFGGGESDLGPNQANADNGQHAEPEPGTAVPQNLRDPSLTYPQPEPRPKPQPKPQPQPKVVEQPKPKPQPKPQPKVVEQPKPKAAPPTVTAASGAVGRRVNQALQLVQQNRLAEARSILNQVLASDTSAQLAQQVRREMAAINEKLVFSPMIDKHDLFSSRHVIKSGEYLSTIAKPHHVPWRFIQKVNRIADPRRVRAGQNLKVITGPFHVVVHKSQYRADVYLGGGENRMYVRSYRVGLGEFNSTPTGKFLVRRGSKLENPEWPDPRTGRIYAANDPNNPIGEHWIGLRGIDDQTRELRGYGLHGTIEPESIGKQASMGCVRFLAEDIAQVYLMLAEEKSTVTILP